MGGQIPAQARRPITGGRRQLERQRHGAMDAFASERRHIQRSAHRFGGGLGGNLSPPYGDRAPAHKSSRRTVWPLWGGVECELRRVGTCPARSFRRVLVGCRDGGQPRAGRSTRHRRPHQFPTPGIPESLAQSFVDLATYGKVQHDWFAIYRPIFEEMAKQGRSPIDYAKAPPSRSPALANDVYVGTYENEFYGNLDIVVQDGALTMRQGPKKSAYPLIHYDRDTFYYDTVGENGVGLSGVTFTIGAEGKAMRVVVENLNQDGLGMFTRTGGK